MSDRAVRVEGLGKRYRLGPRERYRALRDTLAAALTSPVRAAAGVLRGQPAPAGPRADEDLWALRDVSFELEPGDVLGVIGQNGAGKSTLLKILSRVTEPSTGWAEIRGRVGSLLEVGTGFHPELTGRENIALSGAILGMRRREIAHKFDEIVAFAEVERFLDTPVKHYSSGMYLRLGFAVAAHLEPEILLVDEVLAVGDAAFQRKCLGKMGEVAKGGRTVLFVSHNMASVGRLCNKALLLAQGMCAYAGPASEAIEVYLRSGTAPYQSRVDLRQAAGPEPKRVVILTSVSTHRVDGRESCEFATGEGLRIRVGYELAEAILGYCQINVHNLLGERVMTLRSTHGGPPLKLGGRGVIECRADDLRLVSGEYVLMIEVGREFPYREWLDCVLEATRVRVTLGDYLGGAEMLHGTGTIAQQSRWSVEA
jgi:lipopolysaccharide transport system ATP-binding protein